MNIAYNKEAMGLKAVATSYRIPRFIVYWKGKAYDNAPADYDGSGYVGEYRLTKAAAAGEATVRSGYWFVLHEDVPSPYSHERWGCLWAEVVTEGRIVPVGTAAFRFDAVRRRIVAANEERLSEVLERGIGIGRERVGVMQVRNADMAREMEEYTKGDILQQAGQAMLAQANGADHGVLTLLG